MVLPMSPFEERWAARWAEVLTHHERTGRWPSMRKGEPELRILSAWMAMQRRRQKQGRLEPERERIMREAGFDFNPANLPYPREYPASLIEQTVAQYRAGATLEQLARDTHVAAETIKAWIISAGVPIRYRRSSPLTVSNALLVELAGQGLSRREIGERVGMTENAVVKRLLRIRRGAA
jgi:hypothetical protein